MRPLIPGAAFTFERAGELWLHIHRPPVVRLVAESGRDRACRLGRPDQT